MNEFNYVGKKIVREDGYSKVTGNAKFADDYIFPGMLFGVMIRIPVTSAKINSIDFSAIQNSEFLTEIITADDISGAKNVGAIVKDQPVFCKEQTLTCGDSIAMLVGTDEEELRKLVKLVKVDYTEIDCNFDPEKSLDNDTKLLHPELKTNLIIHYPLRKGDVEKGFEDSDYVIEQTYNTGYQEHAYLEPECVIALPGAREHDVEVIGSIQNPFTARNVVAAVLGVQLTNVRIKQAVLGGSFGGKDDTMNIIAARAAIAAKKLRKPIKIKFTREESILESYKRHPYRLNYKVGFTKDGKLKSMKIDLLADGGAYASMSPFVTWRSVVQATGPYTVENVWTDVRAVYTNNPYTGAFRGFGSPQPIFAQESIMDEIAEILNISPIEVRRRNALKQNSVTASGQVLNNHDVNLLEILELANSKTNFEEKWQQYNSKKRVNFVLENKKSIDTIILSENEFIEPEDEYRNGVGLAISYRGCSLGAEGIDAAASFVSIQSDGSIYLTCGLAENGQGLRTTYQIIAAEVFGIEPDNIYYLDHDTVSVPDSGPTVASRGTLMGGGAVKEGAEILKNRLIEFLVNEKGLKEGTTIRFF